MITAIEIENLRGIRAGKLEGLAPLTILTGPNACGKSTVLDALLIGASPDPAEALGRAVSRHSGVAAGSEWLMTQGSRTARIAIRADAEQSWERSLEESGQCDEKLRGQLIEKGLPPPYTMVSVTENEWADEAASVWVAFARENQSVSKRFGGKGLSTIPTVRIVDPGIPSRLDRSFSDARASGRLETVHDLLAQLLPGFERLEILLLAPEAYGLHVTRNGRAVPVGLSGDGIQANIQVALEIALDPGSLALVEEPEVFQHPKAIWLTAKALLANARRGVQTVITTHSLELIDALLGESSQEDREGMALFHMVLEDGELRWGRRSGDDISFARTILESDLR